MNAAHHIKLVVPAVSDFISVVRLAISGIASRMNFTIDEVEDIKLAVSEACTNSVRHAYDKGVGEIYIDCMLQEETLVISIKDTGKGFDTQNIVSPSQTGDSPIGLGLGLTFIKSLMDSLEVTSSVGQGCTVVMSKKKVPANTSC